MGALRWVRCSETQRVTSMARHPREVDCCAPGGIERAAEWFSSSLLEHDGKTDATARAKSQSRASSEHKEGRCSRDPTTAAKATTGEPAQRASPNSDRLE